MTPPLPDWIRKERVPGYTNALGVLCDESRLYGTESLFGDWNGRVLLLAKDFAPSSYLCGRMTEERPYSHDPSFRTNIQLVKRVQRLTTGTSPETCGVLYGSALACLMRNDGERSGALPNREQAIAFGARVLRFVLDHMSRLQVVVCMGDEAWEVSRQAAGFSGEWQHYRDKRTPVFATGLVYVAAYHPAARVSRAQADGPWQLVEKELERLGTRAAA